MNFDKVTTVLGMLTTALVAVNQTNALPGGYGWYAGAAAAVTGALFAYFTNKK